MTGEEKHNDCLHRSDEKEDLSEDCCKHLKNKTGYICWKMAIEDVKPNNCEPCEFFESKSVVAEAGSEEETEETKEASDPFA